MGREDRVRRILRLLVETECALPAVAVFRNAKIRGADFERRSVDNYLRDLHDRGHVRKVDPTALDSGEVVEIPLDEEGWFIATGEGRDALSTE
ncbi:MAG: hypothetical protein ACOCTH_00025 [Halodesulfurarchaeum sp.]